MSVPRVTARRAGRVTTTLNTLADAYRSANPSMDCRWVYDPVHKPELSGVMGRMAEGYRKVYGKDLTNGEVTEAIGLKPDEPIRVGDSVLMGITRVERSELKSQVDEYARDAVQSIDHKFYAAIEGIKEGGLVDGEASPLSDKHRPKPMGRSIIEEREFEFDYTQKTGEEEK